MNVSEKSEVFAEMILIFLLVIFIVGIVMLTIKIVQFIKSIKEKKKANINTGNSSIISGSTMETFQAGDMRKIKRCTSCYMIIAKSAKRCPYCRAKQPKTLFKKLCIYFIVFVLLGSIYLVIASIFEFFDYEKTNNTITADNYNKIKIGMTYDQVVKIFGVKEDYSSNYSSSYEMFGETYLNEYSHYYWYSIEGGYCKVITEDGKVTDKVCANLK